MLEEYKKSLLRRFTGTYKCVYLSIGTSALQTHYDSQFRLMKSQGQDQNLALINGIPVRQPSCSVLPHLKIVVCIVALILL